MPLYEYVNPTTGELIELRRAVEDRNKPILKDGVAWPRFGCIPKRLAIILPGPTAEECFNAEVRKGYYDREQALGSYFNYTGRNGLSKKQLAELWK